LDTRLLSESFEPLTISRNNIKPPIYYRNAWWCFPFEAMEALSCHLMWVAAATYCALLAPKNLLATLIGVLGITACFDRD
jgi:hypothetical protein